MAEESKSSGCPEWMVSYGDMMGLLLCFFVMLVAMSEIKQDRFLEMAKALAEGFGFAPPTPQMPGGHPDLNGLMKQLSQVTARPEVRQIRGEKRPRGPQGQWRRVRQIRDGLKLTIGGPALFPHGSAQLTPELQATLEEIAEALKGKPNKVILLGHASRQPLPPGSPFADFWDLGYQRSKTVYQYLVSQCGLDPRRLQIASAGAEEPLRESRDEAERAVNDRVEIFVTETYVRDYVGNPLGRPEEAEPPPPGKAVPDRSPAPADLTETPMK